MTVGLGSRTPRTANGRGLTKDAQDRLISDGETEYSYSGHGTLTEKDDGTEVTRYTYDALGNLNRVRKAVRPTPTAEPVQTEDIIYAIDGLNRRVGKYLNSALVRQYVWSSALRIEAELDGTGGLVSRFIYGESPNVPELVQRGGDIYRVFTDQLGSPIYVVNMANPDDVLLDATYDEWGNVIEYKVFGLANQPWPLPFGFAGGLYDEDTGLVRFGARDYDPKVGRWTAKDPILFGGGQGNLYVYVGNDSVNHLDPIGLRDWTDTEVRRMLSLYADVLKRSPAPYLLMLDLHRGTGDLDFYSSAPGDTFQLDGYGRMNDAQFGNFIAGYAAGAMDDSLAYWISRFMGSVFGMGGSLFGNAPWGDLRYLGDNEDSVRHMNKGFKFGRDSNGCQ